MTRTLARAGADAILVARNPERLLKAAQTVSGETGRTVHWISFDLTDTRRLPELMDKIFEIGEPDIFFYSTGGPRPGTLMELDMDDWEEAVRLLLYPAVYIARKTAERMAKKRWGRIIFLTSLAIKEPIENIVLSSVVRTSLAGLVRVLARELGRKGITVNGIMPGIIRTERVEEIARDLAERRRKSVSQVLEDMAHEIPLGRLGKPEDIGSLAAFLASDLASYINGAMIPVDGGKLRSIL